MTTRQSKKTPARKASGSAAKKRATGSRARSAKKPPAKAPILSRIFRKERSFKSIALRFVFAFAAIILLLPAAFLTIYKIEAVHPVSTLMVHDGLAGPGARRDWIEFEDMAPVLYQSVMMSEDGQFCAHSGVDWDALNQIIDDALDGERTRGASTITMQLVKNLFLWPNRSFIRKGLEVPYAMMAETILGKKRIMEIYLNIVELDSGVFGVETASQHYFKRSAAKLGPKFSSLLAVTLPNPRGRNPAKPSKGLNSLARTIRARARASGAYIKCLRETE